MPYDPAIHHRRSIRLRGYDYAQAGAYTVVLTATNCAGAGNATASAEVEVRAYMIFLPLIDRAVVGKR